MALATLVILAVVVLYWRKFFNFSRWQFYGKLVIAVIPALFLGFLFSKKIDALLESSLTVAISMLAGGLMSRPPVSKAMPLPTSSRIVSFGSGACPSSASSALASVPARLPAPAAHRGVCGYQPPTTR